MRKISLNALILCLSFCFVFPSEANPLKDVMRSAIVSYKAGNLPKAKALFKQSLQMHSKLAPSHYYLALINKEQQGNVEETIQHLRNAIDADSNHALAHEDLCKVYYAVGQFDKALEYGQKALELNPGSLNTQLALAWTYLLGKNDPGSAIPYFDQVLKKRSLPKAHYGLGLAYYMNHQKYLVLEEITALNKAGETELASNLEQMVRSGSYDSGKPGQALIRAPEKRHLPENISSTSVIVKDSVEGSLTPSQRTHSPQLSTQSANSQVNTLSGAERIRQMQQRSQVKGSGY